MYTKEQYTSAISTSAIAADVCEWSITRYGYFVNSHVDRLEMTKAFAEELSRLPKGCLVYIDKAKNRWIDENNKRPPTMPDFLGMLREFNNSELNQTVKRIEQKDDQINYFDLFDNCSNRDKFKFFARHRSVAPVVRWYAKAWFTENTTFTDEQIIKIVKGRIDKLI